ncbi:hypothetical protein GCM10009565_23430 [Amycolatopsis albidoflavus]
MKRWTAKSQRGPCHEPAWVAHRSASREVTVLSERLTRKDEFSTCYWSENYRACQDLSDLINSGAEASAHSGSNHGHPCRLGVVGGQRRARLAGPRTVSSTPAKPDRITPRNKPELLSAGYSPARHQRDNPAQPGNGTSYFAVTGAWSDQRWS